MGFLPGLFRSMEALGCGVWGFVGWFEAWRRVQGLGFRV